MATKTTTAAAEAKAEATTVDDRVDLYIPRGAANEDPNFFISINGKNYILPRGKTSRVPYCVAAEYHRAAAAQAIVDDRIDALRSDR